MKMRQLVIAVLAAALSAIGLTGASLPALAATTVTLTASGLSPTTVSGTSFDVTNSSGGTATFTATASNIIEVNGTPCVNAWVDCTVPDTATVTVTILPGAQQQQTVTFFFAVQTNLLVTYTGATPTPDPSPVVAESGGPGVHIQQFPRPTSGTCDENQPEGLNWSGVASGGWDESWSRWMHNGRGGDICTRTLAYNNSSATWQVQ